MKRISFLFFFFALTAVASCSQKPDIYIPDVNYWKPTPPADDSFYRGTTMTFASYLEEVGGKVYKENGVAKDPYLSVKDHGGNMIRLSLEPEGYVRTTGMDAISAPDIDWALMSRVKRDMLRAKNAGLEVFLTLKLEKNIARCWLNGDGSVPSNEVLGQKLYDWCYASLEELSAQGTLPKIVAIGNEINAWFMVPESWMATGNEQYNYANNVFFVNKGLAAVKKFNADKGTDIRTACHIFSPSHIKWWFTEHYNRGLTDFDMLALSWYIDYDGHSMGEWRNFKEITAWLKTKNKDLFLLESSYPYTLENADQQANPYNAGLYPNGVTSPALQRAFFVGLARELADAGALGLISWGSESLSTTAYIYANDQWGKGSSWDNNSYWDAQCNLHEGIDWMKDI